VATLHLLLEPRDGEPFRHEVNADAVVIGRSSKADLVLADRFLSRMHARLFRKDDSWYVEDLGSRNTTFINDRPLGQPTVVRPGDVIRLAESRLIVEDPKKPLASGDGLVGGVDENLPRSAILRSATLFLTPEREVARTQGEAVQLAGRLRVLNEVHRALAAPITLEGLLDLVLDRAFAHLRPEEGAIFLRGPDGSLRRAASRQAPGETGEPLFSRRLVQEVVEKGVAALVADASLDERFNASESIVISGVRSLVAAPMLDSEGCVGMIALGAKRRGPFGEADMELLVALASAAALRLRNLALSEETARRRLLDRELELAHDIQMGMLPRAFPQRPEIEVAGALQPARSVGGDLYDVEAEGDRVWLLIGDVSGKGVGAALFMAVTKTLFRAIAAMTRVNRELARDNDRAMFVTAFAARLDVATGELEYVNAGHNPTYRLAAGSGVAPAPLGGAVHPALGAVDGYEYQAGVVRLRPGDLLLMYTDGVVEARNAAGEEFNALRLESYLAGCGSAGADAVVRGLLGKVEDFAGDTPQYDDVTALALRWRGPGA
jgi:sigma-B regulation protein RsbU (phosphoserine phosphatase)